MNRPCLHPGCNGVSPNTRCPEHQAAYWSRRQKTRDQRPLRVYASAEWKRLARAVVADAVACHWCGATNEKLTADHIAPLAFNLDLGLDRDNVVASCRSCQTRRSWESGARR
jgi:5-methylcytosine-specific restriction endonuclease McrA